MRSYPPRGTRVAIVGGGFSGLCAAQSLGKGYDVWVFDPKPDFEFLPNIHELLSGRARAQNLRLPRQELLSQLGVHFVESRVAGLDLGNRQLITDSKQVYGWDLCVVAVGAVHQTGGVPGAAEHAMPFKSIADCEGIVRRLLQLARCRQSLRLVVVGGGPEGIEVLGELLRRLRGQTNWQIDLIEARPRLLNEAPAVLDQTIRDSTAAWPVQFHLGTSVERVHEDSVSLENGLCLPSELTIWTGGGKAPDLLLTSGLGEAPGKWAKVTTTLQTPTYPNVFVVGDAADLPQPAAKQAYHAMAMGKLAAHNVAAMAHGRALRTFSAALKPAVISFGDLDTWVVFGQEVLSGMSLAVLKEGILETTMARLDTRRDVRGLLGLVRRAGGGLDGLVRTLRNTPLSLSRLAGVRRL